MKHRKRLLIFLLSFPICLFGQGAFIPPQTALKTVNGITAPIPGATITVCAASTGGIPCSPALTNTIFSNTALTQPLSNPFTADANGNYQFAVAQGTYTVTVTSLGFSGYSYQISTGTGSVAYYQTIEDNAVALTQRPILNLIPGSNQTINCVDNSGATRTDCTFASTTSSGLPSAQVGDIIRWNVNGDSAWDAVNYAAKTTIVHCDNGGLGLFGVNTQSPNPEGTFTQITPTASDSYACKYSAVATASTNTVIGVQQGLGGNASVYGWNAFYRYTSRFAANNTTNVRYWIGMTSWINGGSGTETELPLGTAKLATNTPDSTTLAFRYAAGTDTTWQATTQITGGSQTIANTGVAIDTNPHFFDIVINGTNALFFIDHALVATLTTNVPTTSSSAGLMSIVWSGDNENTATAIAGTMYYMSLSTK